MSDLVGNPEDRFSQNEAHFIVKSIHKLSPNTHNIVLVEEDYTVYEIRQIQMVLPISVLDLSFYANICC